MLLLFVMAARLAAAGEVVDRVVAVVEDRIVLESDVRWEAAMMQVEPAPALLWARTADPTVRATEAAGIRVLAGDIALYQPDSGSVAERVLVLSDAVGGPAALDVWLAGLGVDREGLVELLRRRMIAEAWAARNVAVRADDEAAWIAACDELVASQLERLRFRRTAPITP
jgi:hypothetical protein